MLFLVLILVRMSSGTTKVMVSRSITNNCLHEGKVDPCVVCSLTVKANSVLCVQCG